MLVKLPLQLGDPRETGSGRTRLREERVSYCCLQNVSSNRSRILALF